MADPDQKLSDLRLHSVSARDRLLIEWNNTAAPFPAEKLVHQLFEEQVRAAGWAAMHALSMPPDTSDLSSLILVMFTVHVVQAERTPDSTAVLWGLQPPSNAPSEQLTYRELNERGNQLAHYLRFLGVGPDTPVPILMKRSLDFIVALVGVLKVKWMLLCVCVCCLLYTSPSPRD